MQNIFPLITQGEKDGGGGAEEECAPPPPGDLSKVVRDVALGLSGE